MPAHHYFCLLNIKISFEKDSVSDVEVQTQNWTNLQEVQSGDKATLQKVAIDKETEFGGQGESTTFMRTSSHPN